MEKTEIQKANEERLPIKVFNPLTGEEVEAELHKGRLLDQFGRELPDPTPMEPPLGHNPQPTLREQMRDMVISEKLAMEAEAAGAESFEDADDFDVGDDYDHSSPYEELYDPTPATELKKRAQEDVKEKKAKASKAKSKESEPDKGETPLSDPKDGADPKPKPET